MLNLSKVLPLKKLGITAHNRAALLDLMLALQSGEIKQKQFDMRRWWEEDDQRHCGSVGCIGGYTEARYNVYLDIDNAGLYDLMYPDFLNRERPRPPRTTPKQGAHAIWNFLTTGEPGWDRVLKGKGLK